MAIMTMAESNVATAQSYYQAMNDKDLDGVARHLHPEVDLIGPIANATGKEAMLEAARRFQSTVNGIKVRAGFGSDDQAMLVYGADFGPPIGICRTAVLMTFKDFLIVRIELFFDPIPFQEMMKKETVVSTD